MPGGCSRRRFLEQLAIGGGLSVAGMALGAETAFSQSRPRPATDVSVGTATQRSNTTPWTLLYVPDVQGLSSYYPTKLYQVMGWGPDHAVEKNIKLIVQAGDFSQGGLSGHPQIPTQNLKCVDILNGVDPTYNPGHVVVPWLFTPGGHDFDGETGSYPDDYAALWYNQFTWAAMSSSYVGQPHILAYGTRPGACNTDSWVRFTAGGKTYLAMAFNADGYTQERYDWAKGVFNAHPTDFGIVVAHDFMQELNGSTLEDQSVFPAYEHAPYICIHSDPTTHTTVHWEGTMKDNLFAQCPNIKLGLHGHAWYCQWSHLHDYGGGHKCWHLWLTAHPATSPTGAPQWPDGPFSTMRFVPVDNKIEVRTFVADGSANTHPQWNFDVDLSLL